MKRLLFRASTMILIALLIFSPPCAYAQVAPIHNSLEDYSQMWNTSNTYFGTITATGNSFGAQLGQQLDTGVNTTVLNLYSAVFKKGAVNTDTFTPAPLIGYGNVTLVCKILKCTGTPTVNVTPVGSLDGIGWAPIPGATVATVSPTSLTVSVNTAWTFALGSTFGGKSFRYYGLSFAGSASSTYSAQGQYGLLKVYNIIKSQ